MDATMTALPTVQPDTPGDLPTLFADLKAHVQGQHANTARPGMGGIWSAEEHRGDQRLRFIMSDGGYNQYLLSVEFDFRLREGFTHARGTFVDLEKGTLDQVKACHRALNLSRTPAAAAIVAPDLAVEAAALLATFQDEGSAAPAARATLGM